MKPPGGGTPYIRNLGVVIGDLVFFKGLFKQNPLKR